MNVTRLAGHTLPNEGRLYENGAYRITDGPAVCSCGDASESLNSDNARRQWHKTHKAEKATGGR